MAATETVYMRVSPDLKAALKDEAAKEGKAYTRLGMEFWQQCLEQRGHSFESGSPAPAASPSAV
jgi:hypothetical protein